MVRIRACVRDPFKPRHQVAFPFAYMAAVPVSSLFPKTVLPPFLSGWTVFAGRSIEHLSALAFECRPFMLIVKFGVTFLRLLAFFKPDWSNCLTDFCASIFFKLCPLQACRSPLVGEWRSASECSGPQFSSELCCLDSLRLTRASFFLHESTWAIVAAVSTWAERLDILAVSASLPLDFRLSVYDVLEKTLVLLRSQPEPSNSLATDLDAQDRNTCHHPSSLSRFPCVLSEDHTAAVTHPAAL